MQIVPDRIPQFFGVALVVGLLCGDTNWTDKLTNYNGTDITYDAIGNPLTYYNGSSYTFTWQNGRQLATANKTGTSVSYQYNDSGIRTQKIVNDVATDYYLNGNQIVTQLTDGARLDFFYDENGSLFGFNYNGANYYYVRNGQNDIIGILDSTGTQVVSYRYDTWGKLLGISGSQASGVGTLNPFRYRGYYYDTETGLYYLNSRYYDPNTGRYLNADSVAGVGNDLFGINVFVYCGNNPVSREDPSGHFWKELWGGIKKVAVSAFKSLEVKSGIGAGIGAKYKIGNVVEASAEANYDIVSFKMSDGVTKCGDEFSYSIGVKSTNPGAKIGLQGEASIFHPYGVDDYNFVDSDLGNMIGSPNSEIDVSGVFLISQSSVKKNDFIIGFGVSEYAFVGANASVGFNVSKFIRIFNEE